MKKILCIICSLIVLFSLTACSNSAPAPSSDPAGSPIGSSASTSGPAVYGPPSVDEHELSNACSKFADNYEAVLNCKDFSEVPSDFVDAANYLYDSVGAGSIADYAGGDAVHALEALEKGLSSFESDMESAKTNFEKGAGVPISEFDPSSDLYKNSFSLLQRFSVETSAYGLPEFNDENTNQIVHDFADGWQSAYESQDYIEFTDEKNKSFNISVDYFYYNFDVKTVGYEIGLNVLVAYEYLALGDHDSFEQCMNAAKEIFEAETGLKC